jgi:hypothetical protein
MIVINGKHIIDIKVNSFTISEGIYNRTYVYNNDIQYIGAQEINTGDSSEFALILNNKIYTNIEIINNNNNLLINNNRIIFKQPGEYNVDLKYKSVKKTITINVKDITLSLA